MKRPILRVLSALLVAGFVTHDIAWAAPEIAALAASASLPRPADIRISPETGIISDSYRGRSGQLLIHIQDAHSNLDAQKNIAKALEELLSRHKIQTVFIEGGTRDDSLNHLRPLASRDVRERVAKEYLMKGELSGAEYLNLSSDLPMRLLGVEDAVLYDESLKAYAAVAKTRENSLAYLDEIEKRIETLKRRLYPPYALELDAMVQKFRVGEKDFEAYYSAVTRAAAASGVAMTAYPEFALLKKLKEKESTAEEYSHLDVRRLLSEAGELEGEIFSLDLTDDLAAHLYELSRWLDVQKKLYSLQASKEDFDGYLRYKKDPQFHPLAVTAFLNRALMDAGLDAQVIAYRPELKDDGKPVEDFYRLAGERDAVFIHKALQHMTQDKITAAVLITGGYHTEHLKELLRERGVSYAVVSPVISEESNLKRYERILLSQKRIEDSHLSYVAAAESEVAQRVQQSLISAATAAGARAAGSDVHRDLIESAFKRIKPTLSSQTFMIQRISQWLTLHNLPGHPVVRDYAKGTSKARNRRMSPSRKASNRRMNPSRFAKEFGTGFTDPTILIDIAENLIQIQEIRSSAGSLWIDHAIVSYVPTIVGEAFGYRFTQAVWRDDQKEYDQEASDLAAFIYASPDDFAVVKTAILKSKDAIVRLTAQAIAVELHEAVHSRLAFQWLKASDLIDPEAWDQIDGPMDDARLIEGILSGIGVAQAGKVFNRVSGLEPVSSLNFVYWMYFMLQAILWKPLGSDGVSPNIFERIKGGDELPPNALNKQSDSLTEGVLGFLTQAEEKIAKYDTTGARATQVHHLPELVAKLRNPEELTREELNSLQELTLRDPKQTNVFGVTKWNVADELAERIKLFRAVAPKFDALMEKLDVKDLGAEDLWSVYVPLSMWLFRRKMQLRPEEAYVVGFTGGIGIGKTTRTQILETVLNEMLRSRNEKVAILSIDDLYKTKKEREPLKALGYTFRGPPGTHDVKLGIETIEALRRSTTISRTGLPKFDKAIDDRIEPELVYGKVGIVIFEGWFLGAETHLDPSRVEPGFKRVVAEALAEYQPLFDQMDDLIVRHLRSLDAIKSMYGNQVERQRAARQLQGLLWKGLKPDQVEPFVEFLYVDSWDPPVTSPDPTDRASSIVIETDDTRKIISMRLGGHVAGARAGWAAVLSFLAMMGSGVVAGQSGQSSARNIVVRSDEPNEGRKFEISIGPRKAGSLGQLVVKEEQPVIASDGRGGDIEKISRTSYVLDEGKTVTVTHDDEKKSFSFGVADRMEYGQTIDEMRYTVDDASEETLNGADRMALEEQARLLRELSASVDALPYPRDGKVTYRFIYKDGDKNNRLAQLTVTQSVGTFSTRSYRLELNEYFAMNWFRPGEGSGSYVPTAYPDDLMNDVTEMDELLLVAETQMHARGEFDEDLLALRGKLWESLYTTLATYGKDEDGYDTRLAHVTLPGTPSKTLDLTISDWTDFRVQLKTTASSDRESIVYQAGHITVARNGEPITYFAQSGSDGERSAFFEELKHLQEHLERAMAEADEDNFPFFEKAFKGVRSNFRSWFVSDAAEVAVAMVPEKDRPADFDDFDVMGVLFDIFDGDVKDPQTAIRLLQEKKHGGLTEVQAKAVLQRFTEKMKPFEHELYKKSGGRLVQPDRITSRDSFAQRIGDEYIVRTSKRISLRRPLYEWGGPARLLAQFGIRFDEKRGDTYWRPTLEVMDGMIKQFSQASGGFFHPWNIGLVEGNIDHWLYLAKVLDGTIPLAREGSYHFHDFETHFMGFLLVPSSIVRLLQVQIEAAIYLRSEVERAHYRGQWQRYVDRVGRGLIDSIEYGSSGFSLSYNPLPYNNFAELDAGARQYRIDRVAQDFNHWTGNFRSPRRRIARDMFRASSGWYLPDAILDIAHMAVMLRKFKKTEFLGIGQSEISDLAVSTYEKIAAYETIKGSRVAERITMSEGFVDGISAGVYAGVVNAPWYRENLRKAFAKLDLSRLNADSQVLDVSTGTGAASLELAQRLKIAGKSVAKLIASDVDFPLAREFLSHTIRAIEPYRGSVFAETEFFILPFDREQKAYTPVSSIPGIQGNVDVALFLNAVHLVHPLQRLTLFRGLYQVLRPGAPMIIGSGGLESIERPVDTVLLDSLFGKMNELIMDIVRYDVHYASIREEVERVNDSDGAKKSRKAFLNAPDEDAVLEDLRRTGFELKGEHSTTDLTREGLRSFLIEVPAYTDMAFPELATLDPEIKSEILRRAYDRLFDNQTGGKFKMWWTTIVAQRPQGARIVEEQKEEKSRPLFWAVAAAAVGLFSGVYQLSRKASVGHEQKKTAARESIRPYRAGVIEGATGRVRERIASTEEDVQGILRAQASSPADPSTWLTHDVIRRLVKKGQVIVADVHDGQKWVLGGAVHTNISREGKIRLYRRILRPEYNDLSGDVLYDFWIVIDKKLAKWDELAISDALIDATARIAKESGKKVMAYSRPGDALDALSPEVRSELLNKHWADVDYRAKLTLRHFMTVYPVKGKRSMGSSGPFLQWLASRYKIDLADESKFSADLRKILNAAPGSKAPNPVRSEKFVKLIGLLMRQFLDENREYLPIDPALGLLHSRKGAHLHRIYFDSRPDDLQALGMNFIMSYEKLSDLEGSVKRLMNGSRVVEMNQTFTRRIRKAFEHIDWEALMGILDDITLFYGTADMEEYQAHRVPIENYLINQAQRLLDAKVSTAKAAMDLELVLSAITDMEEMRQHLPESHHPQYLLLMRSTIAREVRIMVSVLNHTLTMDFWNVLRQFELDKNIPIDWLNPIFEQHLKDLADAPQDVPKPHDLHSRINQAFYSDKDWAKLAALGEEIVRGYHVTNPERHKLEEFLLDKMLILLRERLESAAQDKDVDLFLRTCVEMKELYGKFSNHEESMQKAYFTIAAQMMVLFDGLQGDERQRLWNGVSSSIPFKVPSIEKLLQQMATAPAIPKTPKKGVLEKATELIKGDAVKVIYMEDGRVVEGRGVFKWLDDSPNSQQMGIQLSSGYFALINLPGQKGALELVDIDAVQSGARVAEILTAKEFASFAAREIADEILALQEDPDYIVNVIFATGNTMAPVYEQLVMIDGIEWWRVRAFQLDEYKGLGPEDPASFAHFLRKNVFSKLPIPPEIHMLDGRSPDMRYAEKIKALGGADIVLLGLGRNGHIAGNEGGAYKLGGKGLKLIKMHPSTVKANTHDHPGLADPANQQWYTLSTGDIMDGRRIFLLANGRSKAAAVSHIFRSAPNKKWSGSVLQEHNNLTIILDHAAASRWDGTFATGARVNERLSRAELFRRFIPTARPDTSARLRQMALETLQGLDVSDRPVTNSRYVDVLLGKIGAEEALLEELRKHAIKNFGQPIHENDPAEKLLDLAAAVLKEMERPLSTDILERPSRRFFMGLMGGALVLAQTGFPSSLVSRAAGSGLQLVSEITAEHQAESYLKLFAEFFNPARLLQPKGSTFGKFFGIPLRPLDISGLSDAQQLFFQDQTPSLIAKMKPTLMQWFTDNQNAVDTLKSGPESWRLVEKALSTTPEEYFAPSLRGVWTPAHQLRNIAAALSDHSIQQLRKKNLLENDQALADLEETLSAEASELLAKLQRIDAIEQRLWKPEGYRMISEKDRQLLEGREKIQAQWEGKLRALDSLRSLREASFTQGTRVAKEEEIVWYTSMLHQGMWVRDELMEIADIDTPHFRSVSRYAAIALLHGDYDVRSAAWELLFMLFSRHGHKDVTQEDDRQSVTGAGLIARRIFVWTAQRWTHAHPEIAHSFERVFGKDAPRVSENVSMTEGEMRLTKLIEITKNPSIGADIAKHLRRIADRQDGANARLISRLNILLRRFTGHYMEYGVSIRYLRAAQDTGILRINSHESIDLRKVVEVYMDSDEHRSGLRKFDGNFIEIDSPDDIFRYIEGLPSHIFVTLIVDRTEAPKGARLTDDEVLGRFRQLTDRAVRMDLFHAVRLEKERLLFILDNAVLTLLHDGADHPREAQLLIDQLIGLTKKKAFDRVREKIARWQTGQWNEGVSLEDAFRRLHGHARMIDPEKFAAKAERVLEVLGRRFNRPVASVQKTKPKTKAPENVPVRPPAIPRLAHGETILNGEDQLQRDYARAQLSKPDETTGARLEIKDATKKTILFVVGGSDWNAISVAHESTLKYVLEQEMDELMALADGAPFHPTLRSTLTNFIVKKLFEDNFEHDDSQLRSIKDELEVILEPFELEKQKKIRLLEGVVMMLWGLDALQGDLSNASLLLTDWDRWVETIRERLIRDDERVVKVLDYYSTELLSHISVAGGARAAQPLSDEEKRVHSLMWRYREIADAADAEGEWRTMASEMSMMFNETLRLYAAQHLWSDFNDPRTMPLNMFALYALDKGLDEEGWFALDAARARYNHAAPTPVTMGDLLDLTISHPIELEEYYRLAENLHKKVPARYIDSVVLTDLMMQGIHLDRFPGDLEDHWMAMPSLRYAMEALRRPGIDEQLKSDFQTGIARVLVEMTPFLSTNLDHQPLPEAETKEYRMMKEMRDWVYDNRSQLLTIVTKAHHEQGFRWEVSPFRLSWSHAAWFVWAHQKGLPGTLTDILYHPEKLDAEKVWAIFAALNGPGRFKELGFSTVEGGHKKFWLAESYLEHMSVQPHVGIVSPVKNATAGSRTRTIEKYLRAYIGRGKNVGLMTLDEDLLLAKQIADQLSSEAITNLGMNYHAQRGYVLFSFGLYALDRGMNVREWALFERAIARHNQRVDAGQAIGRVSMADVLIGAISPPIASNPEYVRLSHNLQNVPARFRDELVIADLMAQGIHLSTPGFEDDLEDYIGVFPSLKYALAALRRPGLDERRALEFKTAIARMMVEVTDLIERMYMYPERYHTRGDYSEFSDTGIRNWVYENQKELLDILEEVSRQEAGRIETSPFRLRWEFGFFFWNLFSAKLPVGMNEFILHMDEHPEAAQDVIKGIQAFSNSPQIGWSSAKVIDPYFKEAIHFLRPVGSDLVAKTRAANDAETLSTGSRASTIEKYLRGYISRGKNVGLMTIDEDSLLGDKVAELMSTKAVTLLALMHASRGNILFVFGLYAVDQGMTPREWAMLEHALARHNKLTNKHLSMADVLIGGISPYISDNDEYVRLSHNLQNVPAKYRDEIVIADLMSQSLHISQPLNQDDLEDYVSLFPSLRYALEAIGRPGIDERRKLEFKTVLARATVEITDLLDRMDKTPGIFWERSHFTDFNKSGFRSWIHRNREELSGVLDEVAKREAERSDVSPFRLSWDFGYQFWDQYGHRLPVGMHEFLLHTDEHAAVARALFERVASDAFTEFRWIKDDFIAVEFVRSRLFLELMEDNPDKKIRFFSKGQIQPIPAGARIVEALKPRVSTMVAVMFAGFIALYTVMPAEAGQANVTITQVENMDTLEGAKLYSGIEEYRPSKTVGARAPEDDRDDVDPRFEESGADMRMINRMGVHLDHRIPGNVEIALRLLPVTANRRLFEAHVADLMKGVIQYLAAWHEDTVYLDPTDFQGDIEAVYNAILDVPGFNIKIGQAPADGVTARLDSSISVPSPGVADRLHFPVQAVGDGDLVGWFGLIVLSIGSAKYFAAKGLKPSQILPEHVDEHILEAVEMRSGEKPTPDQFVKVVTRKSISLFNLFRLKPITRMSLEQAIKVLEGARISLARSA